MREYTEILKKKIKTPKLKKKKFKCTELSDSTFCLMFKNSPCTQKFTDV